MSAREDTKLRILEAGGRLVHEKGFNNTGLSEILQAAAVPKGSFYYYFKNKEEFGSALVDHYAQHGAVSPGSILRDESIAPLDRIGLFFAETRRVGQENGYSLGCPLGKMVQEMSEVSEPIRTKLQGIFHHIVDEVCKVLGEAKQLGELAEGLDVQQTAGLIVSAWQGGVMRMKLERGPQPLEELEQGIIGLLQKK